jgi:hypothetical protein
MKRAFLLIIVPALLVALGFSQTPAPSVNTDRTNIKGCLGGSDGNYTVAEDNTGHTFKITTSGVDLKQHLGHDVTLIGYRASGTSSVAADNSFAVTELTMISDHCAAAAAPTATVSTPSETASTPASPTASAVAAAPAAAPTTSTSTLSEAEVAPAADAAATAGTVATPAEPTLTPAPSATPPAEMTVTPTPAPAASAETASTVWDKPAAEAAPPTRRPERFRNVSAAPVAAAIAPAVTASNSSQPAGTPDVAATTPAATANSSGTVTTPDAASTAPPAPARHSALWLLIAFAVVVIALGIFVPFLSRWRKQKSMARTDAPNLSFTREASTDQDKKDSQGPPKAA